MHHLPATSDASAARTIARQRLVITALTGALGLLVGLGLGGEPPTKAAEPVPTADATAPFQYVAGDNRLYRIHDSGEIEYLIVDFAHGTVAGIPGWATLRVDHSLSRDRMGNVVRSGGN
ncbi:MAG: hypothetical protein ACF8LK_09840 [Phycisphaerales bacterium JB041]